VNTGLIEIGYRDGQRYVGSLTQFPNGEWSANLFESATNTEKASKIGDLRTCVSFLVRCASNLGYSTGRNQMADAIRQTIVNQGPL